MEKQDRERASAPIAQERVRRRSKKKRREVQRRTSRLASSLPAPAERLGPDHFYGAYQRCNSNRKKCLLAGPLLELFLDRSAEPVSLRLSQQFEACHTALDIRIFQGTVVALFHSGDFVDPAVRFIHVHDKTIVPAVIDFVSGEAVAR